jgi:hypothetical protein
MECTSDILVTYAKILNSRHVLIDKMVLEFLCCIGFSCNNNVRCERWTHPTYSEMSQLSAVHYIVFKDPGVTVLHSEVFSGYPECVQAKAGTVQCTLIYPWADCLVCGLS